MTHLLLGIDPSRISYSPFAPTTVDPVSLRASELDLPVLPSAWVWVAPAVASYVGGDIVGVMLSTNLGRRRGTTLVIDVGTNGEIVLAHQRRLFATAAPAGPAFEGAEITRGMRAAPGAIERVRITPNSVGVDVIGGGEPEGICGSGLVDAVAELLRVGAVAPSGRLLSRAEMERTLPGLANRVRPDDTGGEFVLTGDPASPEESIALHAQDIRRLQLAKGSIRCGANVLLREAGLKPSDLDRVLLAGAFGSYIDPGQSPGHWTAAAGAGRGGRGDRQRRRTRRAHVPAFVDVARARHGLARPRALCRAVRRPRLPGSVRRRHGVSSAGLRRRLALAPSPSVSARHLLSDACSCAQVMSFKQVRQALRRLGHLPNPRGHHRRRRVEVLAAQVGRAV